MSWGISLWVYPVLDSLGFLDLGDKFLPHLREVFNYYLKYFPMVFLFVFFFCDSYDSNVGTFNIILEVSEIVLIYFNFSFFLPDSFISTILSSTSLILSSASTILLIYIIIVILPLLLFLFYYLLPPECF